MNIMELELFNTLVSQNQFWDAQLVGKNLLCKKPGDKEVFEKYFDYCIKISLYPIDTPSRKFFLKEGELSLSIFCEHAAIEKNTLDFIEAKRQKLIEANHLLNDRIVEEMQNDNQKIENANTELIEELIKLKGKFIECKSEKTFDTLISKMSEIESSFNKEAFTQTQKLHYETLTKDFSNLVSQALSKINKEKDTKYNKQAAESFKKAFDLFKGNTSSYIQSDSKLYELVAKYLFAYDSKRLFNETLIFYNHVYTFIFNKLDDDGKFRFTQYSFDTPQK